MDVLVTHASRNGATDAIARRVAERLQTRGLRVQLVAVGEVQDIEAYDAVVIGGGTAGTHWLRPARRFVQRHEEELARRPVWLFGSVDPPTEDQVGAGSPVSAARPREFDEFHRLVEAVDEAVFVRGPGVEDQPVGLVARLWRRLPGGSAPQVTTAAHDPRRVDAWADEIADRLEQRRRDRAIDQVHEMRDDRVHEMRDADADRA